MYNNYLGVDTTIKKYYCFNMFRVLHGFMSNYAKVNPNSKMVSITCYEVNDFVFTL